MALYILTMKDWRPVKSKIPTSMMFIIVFFLLIDMVHGYYCEWNLCEADQYCCGDNQCCNNVYSLWYFWAGIIFLAIMILSFGGFFRYCYAYRPQIIVHQITNFVPLPSDRTCPEEMQGLVAYEDVEPGPDIGLITKNPPLYSKLGSPIK